MKTNHTHQASLPTTASAKAGNNLFGGILLLSLASTAIISANLAAFSELFLAFESQWMNFTHAMSGFMTQAHPAQW